MPSARRQQPGRAGHRDTEDDRDRLTGFLGGLAPGAHLRAPPHDGRRRHVGVVHQRAMLVEQWRGDGQQVRARTARSRHARAVRGSHVSGQRDVCNASSSSSSREQSCLRMAASIVAAASNAASRRRARNSSGLMLPVFSPSVLPISWCDEPCAYASQSSSRSRRFSR